MTVINALRKARFIALGLAGALLVLSCAQNNRAGDRLEVTYYYLPG